MPPEFSLPATVILAVAIGSIIAVSYGSRITPKYGEFHPRSPAEREYKGIVGRYPHKSLSRCEVSHAIYLHKTAESKYKSA